MIESEVECEKLKFSLEKKKEVDRSGVVSGEEIERCGALKQKSGLRLCKGIIIP